MKRITKKRLAELRRLLVSDHPMMDVERVVIRAEDLTALLDAYERRPDEVFEGYQSMGQVPLLQESSDTCERELYGLLYLDQYQPSDRRVRVEVYYLKEAKRGAQA